MMEKISAFFKTYRWPLLSGALIGTTYVPFPPWALIFCYAPLWLWLDENATSRKQAFWGGWWTQFTLSIIGFHWIAYTAKEFGDFPWSLSFVVLGLFAALIHLYIPLAALVSWELRQRLQLGSGAGFVVSAIVLSLFERMWPSIFPWHLGYTLLWAKLPVYQWADVIGFEGLSTMVLLLNAWVAYIWQVQDDTVKVFRHASLLAGLIVVLTVSGLWKKREWKTSADSRIKVLGVQANIGNIDRFAAEHGNTNVRATLISRYVDLTKQGLNENPGVDLIVWPETAFPAAADRPDLSAASLGLIRSGLAAYGRPILTGALAQDLDAKPPFEKPAVYNALFLLNAQGETISGPYRKTLLLAFGEYLPFSETFPKLLQLLPFVSNFGRGPGPSVLEVPRPDGRRMKLGAQICYEGLFPWFSRELSDKGADVLANVTNDSWFGSPFEPRQHMIMTLARAIETRRPLIRATNTGITTAITAAGDQLGRSPVGREWAGTFDVPYRKDAPQTLFSQYGHWDWVIWLLALLGILVPAFRRMKRA